MSSYQSVNVYNICDVNYGSHIGEFIRYKLDKLGITQAHLAKGITSTGRTMTRSNLNRILTNKSECTPSELKMFRDVLPAGFFDEFFEVNKSLKDYMGYDESPSFELQEPSPAFATSGSGYRITIEIDPIDFDPGMLEPLSDSLRTALEDFHSRIKKD